MSDLWYDSEPSIADTSSGNLWSRSSANPRSRGYGGGRTSLRGGSNSNYRSQQPVSLPPDLNLLDGLHDTAIETIPTPTVGSSSGDPVKPKHVKYIGSYNWVEESHPTIIVPGSPPEWRDRPFPYRVPFDTGVRFIDQNGYRMGSESCLLPLFRAVDIVAEENADTSMNWSDVDFVTDRNGLRKLMRWIRHSGSDSAESLKEFRIDLQLGGRKTVLMHRLEKRTREIAVPPRAGCGISFEKESTTPAQGCNRSTGHHRIVQYDLGGLKMVVRFEVDACIPQSTADNATSSLLSQPTSPRIPPASPNVDSLTDLLSNLDVTSQSEASSQSQNTAIAVIRAGSQVPQSSLVELTTRSFKYVNEFDWQEAYPQLFLSWTPHLFLAVHDRGTFESMVKHKLGATELRNLEASPRTQQSFRKLVETLKTIQTLVRRHGRRGRLSLVCQADGTLNVFERTSPQGCLPDSELERFGV